MSIKKNTIQFIVVPVWSTFVFVWCYACFRQIVVYQIVMFNNKGHCQTVRILREFKLQVFDIGSLVVVYHFEHYIVGRRVDVGALTMKIIRTAFGFWIAREEMHCVQCVRMQSVNGAICLVHRKRTGINVIYRVDHAVNEIVRSIVRRTHHHVQFAFESHWIEL